MRIPRLVTLFASAFGLVALSFTASGSAQAQQPAPTAPKPAAPVPAAAPGGPPEVTYEKFTKDAEKQPGLFTLWHKDGKVYIELSKDQLGKEYYEHATTANGLGGVGILSGDDLPQEGGNGKFVRCGPQPRAPIW